MGFLFDIYYISYPTNLYRIKMEVESLTNQLAALKEENRILTEKSLRYEMLFELSEDAILVIEDNTFTDCNHAVVKMLGYKNKNQFLNTHPSELSPERQPDGQLSFEKAQNMMELAISNGSHRFEWIHTKANGENFPVEVWLSAIKYHDKLLINTTWRDLTEIKKTETKIQNSLLEKETLLKEVHHRVKNNMQIITSLLSLQANTNNNQAIKEQFNACQYRINSMATIHEMLYQSEIFSKIEYGSYLQQLITHLINSIKGVDNNITLQLQSDDINLNIDTAIPLGLLINEIITNALKYGVKNSDAGIISVNLEKIEGVHYRLKIGDDGVGISETNNSTTKKTLGLKLINRLSSQLGGKFKRDNSKKGTHYILNFTEIIS